MNFLRTSYLLHNLLRHTWSYLVTIIMFIREVNSIPQGANYSLKVSKVTLQKIEIGALAWI